MSEVENYSDRYIAGVVGRCRDRLIQGMARYMKFKEYKTNFCDLVPIITSNALGINIVIIENRDENVKMEAIPDKLSYSTTICVKLSNVHYEAIYPHILTRDGPGMFITWEMIKSSETEGSILDLSLVASSSTNALNDSANISARVKTDLVSPTEPTCTTYCDCVDHIRFCFWNINGLTATKLSDCVLGGFLKSFHVIMLCETWSDGSDSFELEGFVYYDFPRKYRHKNAKRASGGLGLFVNNEIKRGVEIIKNCKDVLLWVKLRSDFFHIDSDIYIANVYVVPEHSTNVTNDAFGMLQCELANLPSNYKVLMCGDLNAATNIAADFLDQDIQGTNIDWLENVDADIENDQTHVVYNYLNERGLLGSSSMDTRKIDKHGRDLLDLCKSTNMVILNGRIGLDKGIGHFTRVDTTDCSVVDYLLSSICMIDEVKHFAVHQKLPESDHLALAYCIKLNRPRSGALTQNRTHWSPIHKYKWNDETLPNIRNADDISEPYRTAFRNTIINMESSNQVASKFDEYSNQAIERVCDVIKVKPYRQRGPIWFDKECKIQRHLAIKAGERVKTKRDNVNLMDRCREYRAIKQKKERNYKKYCADRITNQFHTNKSDMWKLLSTFSPSKDQINMPSGDAFFEQFTRLSQPAQCPYFDYTYEHNAIRYLSECDGNPLSHCIKQSLDIIMNSNFTENEIIDIIHQLKNNKSAGIDSIPAEFVKCCSDVMAADMEDMFNYALEKREFPDIWTEGVRTPVYKSGMKLDTNNYRGITVLPVYEKVFELAVQRRFEFVNGAFDKADRHNGGFASGNRTSDNIFILQGLIQRQLSLGQSLIVIFVDFTKAFDLVNRNILFYKLMENGFSGRVLDTLRNLYSKTHFRVKHKGEVSSPIKENVGVNQGGNCSPMLFRKYLADLNNYLSTYTGICVNEETMIHRLWADDLFTVANSVSNAQKQMDGLLSFCKSNQTIVNELKTKVMMFGNTKEELRIKFNGTLIEHVDRYKCLGNVFNTTRTPGVICLNKTMNTYVTGPVVPYSVCWSAFEMLHHYHPSACFTYSSHWLNRYCGMAVTCGAWTPPQAIN